MPNNHWNIQLISSERNVVASHSLTVSDVCPVPYIHKMYSVNSFAQCRYTYIKNTHTDMHKMRCRPRTEEKKKYATKLINIPKQPNSETECNTQMINRSNAIGIIGKWTYVIYILYSSSSFAVNVIDNVEKLYIKWFITYLNFYRFRSVDYMPFKW